MAGHAPTIGIKPLPGAKVAIISSSWHLNICNLQKAQLLLILLFEH